MNEKTETNINEAIDWLQKTAEGVQDFAVEQAPLYCKEVVAWQLWSSLIWAVFGLLVVIIAVYLIGRCIRSFRDKDEICVGFGLGGAVLMVAGLFPLLGGTMDAVKAAVAPRIVIIEHLRGLK